MKTLSSLIAGIGLVSLLSCGDNPTGPQIGDRETRTRTELVSISSRFDVIDTEYHSETAQGIEGIRESYPTMNIRPDTMSFDGNIHLLGFNVYGEVEIKVEEFLGWNRNGFTGKLRQEIVETKKEDLEGFYQQLQSELDGVAGDGDYLRFGESHVGHVDGFKMDLPNVPESPDLLERLDGVNNAPINAPINGDIGYNLVYLRNRDRSVASNELGEKIIDGFEVYPKVEENAGYSGMGYDAIWAITGDERWLDPQVRYPYLPKIEGILILPDSTSSTDN